MANELCEEWEQKMRLMTNVAAQRPAHSGLDGFEAATQRPRRGLAHHRERREVAVAFIGGNLDVSQGFWHDNNPGCCSSGMSAL